MVKNIVVFKYCAQRGVFLLLRDLCFSDLKHYFDLNELIELDIKVKVSPVISSDITNPLGQSH